MKSRNDILCKYFINLSKLSALLTQTSFVRSRPCEITSHQLLKEVFTF